MRKNPINQLCDIVRGIRIMNQELNQLLDQVYDLQDISSEVGKDLEKLIFEIVEKVEYMVELEDLGAWVLKLQRD